MNKEGRQMQKELANNEFFGQTQIDKLNATYDKVRVWYKKLRKGKVSVKV